MKTNVTKVTRSLKVGLTVEFIISAATRISNERSM